jgi:hypothetical protein
LTLKFFNGINETHMTEAAKFRPSREVPFGAQLTGESPSSTGLQKRLEIENLWSTDGIDKGVADFVDGLPRLIVECALDRLGQGTPAEFVDIDKELGLAPAAAIEIPEDTMATEGLLLGEASAEDRRDQIDEARDGDVSNDEFDPYARLDVADAAAFE